MSLETAVMENHENDDEILDFDESENNTLDYDDVDDDALLGSDLNATDTLEEESLTATVAEILNVAPLVVECVSSTVVPDVSEAGDQKVTVELAASSSAPGEEIGHADETLKAAAISEKKVISLSSSSFAGKVIPESLDDVVLKPEFAFNASGARRQESMGRGGSQGQRRGSVQYGPAATGFRPRTVAPNTAMDHRRVHINPHFRGRITTDPRFRLTHPVTWDPKLRPPGILPGTDTPRSGVFAPFPHPIVPGGTPIVHAPPIGGFNRPPPPFGIPPVSAQLLNEGRAGFPRNAPPIFTIPPQFNRPPPIAQQQHPQQVARSVATGQAQPNRPPVYHHQPLPFGGSHHPQHSHSRDRDMRQQKRIEDEWEQKTIAFLNKTQDRGRSYRAADSIKRKYGIQKSRSSSTSFYSSVHRRSGRSRSPSFSGSDDEGSENAICIDRRPAKKLMRGPDAVAMQMDDEYMRKLEEQKRQREALLKAKAERRQQKAAVELSNDVSSSQVSLTKRGSEFLKDTKTLTVKKSNLLLNVVGSEAQPASTESRTVRIPSTSTGTVPPAAANRVVSIRRSSQKPDLSNNELLQTSSVATAPSVRFTSGSGANNDQAVRGKEAFAVASQQSLKPVMVPNASLFKEANTKAKSSGSGSGSTVFERARKQLATSAGTSVSHVQQMATPPPHSVAVIRPGTNVFVTPSPQSRVSIQPLHRTDIPPPMPVHNLRGSAPPVPPSISVIRPSPSSTGFAPTTYVRLQ